jgi:alpha-L-rhamnosidase
VTNPPLTPTGPRCAHKVNPLGVAADRVWLSWRLSGSGRDRRQAAYQVRVWQDADPRWDTGQVESAVCTGVGYAGAPLTPGGRYDWRVRVWDEGGAVSEWSEPAWFEVELDPAHWQASWIGLGAIRENFLPPAGDGPSDGVANALRPAPYLRHAFVLDEPVAWARLYVTALGLYEARLNGQRAGDYVLAPGWTDYARRIPYQTYDVGGLLHEGENVFGAIVADGWYCGFIGFDAKRAGAQYGDAPEFLAQLVIGLAGGGRRVILTGDQWRARFAAIRHADLLMGERHDLTLEPSGWDLPGYADDDWQPVRARGLDGRPLVADPGPPIRVIEDVVPRSIATDDDGRHIVDFGQNLTGWLRLRASAGARIRIRHGEMLTADGDLYTENLRTARQTDEFVTGGGVLEPRFTLHGFRYAEISGYPGDIGQADIVARVVHSDIERAGSFECSLPWLNQLARNIDWGQRGNFISVPTDCPQRDERLGWLGDAQIFARTACYNRDVAAFFGKWLDDVADAQQESGAYSDIAPRLNIGWSGAPAWGDAGVIVPWTLWQMYGDTAILDRHFGAMTAWMDFLERGNPGYLRTRELGNSYNDWLAPGTDLTPPELLATAYWAHDAALMAEIAEVLGRPDDAAGYRALRAKIRAAFAEAFVYGDGRMLSGTQTSYVLGLHMDLVEGSLRDAAARHLVAAIEAASWHLTTGFAGVGYILPVLCSTGHADVAFRLLTQESAPSWRYMVDNGATTIWERWDGWTAERGFQSAWMNSFNHYSLGSVGEWLYRFVLGIDQQPGTAGFGRLLIRPQAGGGLDWARGAYRSVQGPVSTSWERSSGQFALRVSLPPNVTASVRVPSGAPSAVRRDGVAEPSAIAPYPGALGRQEAVFEVGSGVHEFAGPA